MSWTEVFPIFTDEMVEVFEKEASSAERAELEEWYGVAEVFNSQPDCRHIVSVSLFWKNVRLKDGELPEPSRELMQQAQEKGLALRFRPWDHYVQPILDTVPQLRERFPEIVFRVHLASDLVFLVDDLIEAGCEVLLMKSSSIRFAPGGLWRFLPFDEEGKLVTVVDIDRIAEIEGDIERTLVMDSAGVDAWRTPVTADLTSDDRVTYLPFMGCQFGVRGGMLETRKLLDAFTWHALRGTVDFLVMYPGRGPLPILSHKWPDYGFDEFFMTLAAYPRLAMGGMLTFVPSGAQSLLLLLDIEYVTWGNPNSELVFFDRLDADLFDDRTDVGEGEATGASSIRLDACESEPASFEPESKVDLAFLFMCKDELHHPVVWNEYLRGHDAATFFINLNEKGGGWEAPLSGRIVSQTQVSSDTGIHLSAMLDLLKSSLADSTATHFIFVSDSCVPVRSLEELERSLRLDPRSRIKTIPWSRLRRADLLKAQRAENIAGIRKELVHFHDVWIILSREDAELVTKQNWAPVFEGTQCPEEYYFATVLVAEGFPPLKHVAPRLSTWVGGGRFDGVPPRTVSSILDSGCFFAHSFNRDSNIGTFGLHQGGW